MDCTGSMGQHIEAVKNNVQQLRDRLVKEYKKCDLVFSFVRYTDYDQPANSRTTYLPFTKSVHCRSLSYMETFYPNIY